MLPPLAAFDSIIIKSFNKVHVSCAVLDRRPITTFLYIFIIFMKT